MGCTNLKIANNILRDCSVNPIKGIYDEVVVIRREDIDYTATTVDASNLMITNLVLKTGKTGYKLEGIADLHSISYERKKSTFGYVYTHKYSGVLLDGSAEAHAELFKLLGDDVIIVARKKFGDKGNGAFIVLGWDLGLEGQVHTYNSNTDSGVEKFELSTPSDENSGETKPPYMLFENSFEATKTAFENAFAS